MKERSKDQNFRSAPLLSLGRARLESSSMQKFSICRETPQGRQAHLKLEEQKPLSLPQLDTREMREDAVAGTRYRVLPEVLKANARQTAINRGVK
jgi:hypothetical protein